MTAYCQPVSRNVAEAMLQVAVRALCDRADDSPELREGRTRQLVTTTLGLAPRDGVELMLATLAFGHFQVILDSMGDVFRGQADAMKAKTKTTIVPLGRAMLEMLRELRQMQARPTIQMAEAVRTAATAEPQPRQSTAQGSAKAAPAPPDPMSIGPGPLDPGPLDPALVDPAPVDLAPVDLAPVDLTPVDPAPRDLASADLAPLDPASIDPAPPDPERLSEAELATLSDPRLGLPPEVIAWLAGTAPASPGPVRQEPPGPAPVATPPASREPARQRLNIVSPVQPPARNSDSARFPMRGDAGAPMEDPVALRDHPLPPEYETLAQHSARNVPNARAAGGD